MIRPLATDAAAPAPDPRLHEAARAMESMLLKQIVVASGTFKGGEGPGSAIRADLFAQTLSDALSNGGGIGLAAMIERSLGAGAADAPPVGGPARPGALPAIAPGGGAPGTPRLLLGHPRLARPVDRAAPGPLDPPSPPPQARLSPGELSLSAPVAGAPTSSPFGLRTDPFTGLPAHHHGLDLAAPEGTPVEASAGGVVVQAGHRAGYGLAVEIDHGHGITTLYGHASEILVQPGQRIERGEPVARVGDTGRSTGPHLHFEVRTQGNPVDPRRALSAYQNRVDEPHRSGS